MTNKLSPRLEAVIRFVKNGSYPADVGSDHALVPIELVSRGICERVFAIDNKEGPFLTMKKAIEELRLSKRIEISLSNGIEAIPEKINGLILAGMGGLLIREILSAHKEKLNNIKYLVIDAHSDMPILLEWLGSFGFKAQDDLFLFDKGKPYCVYLFCKELHPVIYTREELFLGPIEIKRKSAAWKKHYSRILSLNNNILENKALPEKRRASLQEENAMIQKALHS